MTCTVPACGSTSCCELRPCPFSYVKGITKNRKQIVKKTFVQMMYELGCDVALTDRKDAAK